MRRDAAIFGVIGDVAVGKLFALWRDPWFESALLHRPVRSDSGLSAVTR
jgi:hypothetical protein